MANTVMLLIVGVVALFIIILGYFVLRKMVQAGRLNSEGATVALILLVLFAVAGFFAFFFITTRVLPMKYGTYEVVYGKAENCSLTDEELFPFEGKVTDYDFETPSFSIGGIVDGIKLEGYLGDTAYYDEEQDLLYLDFGFKDTFLPTSDDTDITATYAVLTCEENRDYYGNSFGIWLGMIKPGTKVVSIPRSMLEGDTLTLSFVICNTAKKYTLEAITKEVKIERKSNIESENSKPEVSLPEPEKQPETISPEPEVQQPESLSPEAQQFKNILVGKWATAFSEYEHTIDTIEFEFMEDGTFVHGFRKYLNAAYHSEVFGEGRTGWETAPIGFPRIYGTYEIKDSDTIILHYTHGDYEMVFDDKFETDITVLSDNKINFVSHGMSLVGPEVKMHTYLKGYDQYYDLEMLSMLWE